MTGVRVSAAPCGNMMNSRKQYYLHSYTVEQPDLNWNNPSVVKEMQDIVGFGVNLGVSGSGCNVID